MELLNCSGSVNLDVDVNAVIVYVAGYSDFSFAGKAHYGHFILNSASFCNTYDLNIRDSLTIISDYKGCAKINVGQADFRAEIDGGGDIWHIGFPSSTKANLYGTGSLLNKN